MSFPSEPISQEVRDGLNTTVRDALLPAAAVLGMAHLCYAVVHTVGLVPGSSNVVITVDGLTSAAGFLLCGYFSRGRVSPASAHLWAAVMVWLALGDYATQVYYNPSPDITIFVTLVIVAIGCFVLSWPWLYAHIGATLAVWFEGMLLNPGAGWGSKVHIIVISILLGFLLHSIRWRTYSQYEQLKQQLEQTARRLRTRLELGQLITKISTRFLTIPWAKIDEAIPEAMREVGECMQISHVCVCRVDRTAAAFSMTHEWCGPDGQSRKLHMQNIPVTCLPWCWNQLQEDREVRIDRLSKLPSQAQADRLFLDQNRIRSFFAVPLVVEGTPWGILALATEREDNQWSEDTGSLLKVFGEIIVAALKREEAEAEISSLNRQLEKASRLVSMGEMAAHLAHDLGNNVSSILQFTGGAHRRASNGKLTVENCYECIQDIQEQGDYMRDILLMIQKFFRSRISERTMVELPEVIKQCGLLLKGKLRQESITLTFSPSPKMPSLMADPVQIMLVTINLILNAAQAMKDTEEDKRQITVSYRQQSDCIEVSIRDHGPGVPDDLREKIFEKFFSTKEDGLGLGLAFSRLYIEQHGGKLWCDCDGTGSDFRFSLPLVAAPIQQEAHV